MPARLISDIMHLKRVHAMVPDHILGTTIKGKLKRLNLKPAITEIRAPHASGSLSSSPLHSFRGPAADNNYSMHDRRTYLIQPNALCQLLECLAYFELGREEVTRDTMEILQASLPRMTSAQLSKALAASCALGQQGVEVPTLSLLSSALSQSFVDQQGKHGTSHATSSGKSVGNNNGIAGPTVSELIHLMESLRRADVQQEEVWSMLAEHCVRIMDRFDGKELFRIIEIFHTQGMTHYPDFFVSAESYIAGQHHGWMSPEHLDQVVGFYKELGQPVVSLMSASAGRFGDTFDSSLATAAGRLPQRRGQPPGHLPKNRHDGPKGVASTDSIASFAATATDAFRDAEGQELLDMLLKCEHKGVAHSDIVDAAVSRLHTLYFEAPNAPMDISRLTQCISTLMEPMESTLFTPETAKTLQLLLDTIAPEAFKQYNPRLLFIADGAIRLLPPQAQPRLYYKELVEYLKQAREVSAPHMSAKGLMLLSNVLVALQPYGGHEVLTAYLPIIALAAANSSRRTQIELASVLSALPAAKADVLPGLFKAVTSTKNWSRQLTPIEAKQLLTAMLRSGTGESPIVLGVVEMLRTRRSAFDSDELASMMHTLALLGFRDIDFFSSTAEYLLGAASATSGTRTSVHDLCSVLHTLTFCLKGVIRVVQQILARLRVAAGQATPQDITRAFYSFVRLQITRHTEVTGPFCDRALSILPQFKPQELTSVMGSLRALGYYHEGLIKATVAILEADTLRRRGQPLDLDTSPWPHVLTDSQYLSLTAAVVNLSNLSASRRREASKKGEPITRSSDEVSAASLILNDTVQQEFRRIALQWVQLRGRHNGLQLYLVLTTLPSLPAADPCSTAEWAVLAVQAENHVVELTRGDTSSGQSSSGQAAAEVMIALKDLEAKTVPTLPVEEEALRKWTQAVDQWGTKPTPELMAVAKKHIRTILVNNALRENLKRVGLLSQLTSGDTIDLGGATVTGKSSRRGGAGRREAALTVEGLMTAIDAELEGGLVPRDITTPTRGRKPNSTTAPSATRRQTSTTPRKRSVSSSSAPKKARSSSSSKKGAAAEPPTASSPPPGQPTFSEFTI